MKIWDSIIKILYAEDDNGQFLLKLKSKHQRRVNTAMLANTAMPMFLTCIACRCKIQQPDTYNIMG